MEVAVICEYRFYQTPDGKVWTASAFNRSFWRRYLNVFEKVKIVARAKRVEQADPTWLRVDSNNISFAPLPYYQGLAGMMLKLWTLVRVLRSELSSSERIIYRVPSQTAMLAMMLHPSQEYALEVVGDPQDVFAAGITRTGLDRILGWVSTHMLKYMCQRAMAVSYVTTEYLQQKYPPGINSKSVACSSLELDPTWLASAPRQYTQSARKLLFVGSLSQLYKGPDVLLRALAKLNELPARYELTMVGDGEYRAQMESLARTLHCDDSVCFTGEVAPDRIRQLLLESDLFVMPSRTEGLPRALIEAMATGLPAIGTRVGGIPELLDSSCLVEAENVDELSATIASLSNSTALLEQHSAQNIQTARGYSAERLQMRRNAFYKYVLTRADENENTTFA